MSHLQNKSGILSEAAILLNESSYYPAVAHGAYYSCLLLMKHIWIYRMGKNEDDLMSECRGKGGTHEILINRIGKYIKDKSTDDFKHFNNNITQLKRLRIDADYKDALFDSSKSDNALRLSQYIIPILKTYLAI